MTTCFAVRTNPIAVPLLPLFTALLAGFPALVQAQYNFFTNNDNTITITAYTGPQSVAVAIPDSITGLPVTVIADEAFFGAHITSVTFPSNLASLGEGVFANNFGWTGPVTFPNTLTNIGPGCFGATEVSSVLIPAGVLTIGDGAFANAYGLTAITVDPANPNYSNSIEGVLFSKDGTSLLQYPSDLPGPYTIPDTVTYIGYGAFAGSEHLGSIAVPNAVTNIGDRAFGNSYLVNISFGTNVANIGYGEFQTAYLLQGIYFGGNAPTFAGGEFTASLHPIVYYLPGTTGWGTVFDTVPTELWNPQAVAAGVQNNQFGFNITGSTNLTVVVQAATNLVNPSWQNLSTISLTSAGTGSFSDSDWANHCARFYRFTNP
jgi:hypothetical protein